MKIRPIRDKIIGLRVKVSAETRAGLIVPEVAREPSQIVYVAESASELYKRGDVILVRSHVGYPIQVDDVILSTFKAEEVLGKLSEDAFHSDLRANVEEARLNVERVLS